MDEKDPPIVYRKGFGQVPTHEDASEKKALWKAFLAEFAQGHSPDEEIGFGDVIAAYEAFVKRQDANA